MERGFAHCHTTHSAHALTACDEFSGRYSSGAVAGNERCAIRIRVHDPADTAPLFRQARGESRAGHCCLRTSPVGGYRSCGRESRGDNGSGASSHNARCAGTVASTSRCRTSSRFSEIVYGKTGDDQGCRAEACSAAPCLARAEDYDQEHQLHAAENHDTGRHNNRMDEQRSPAPHRHRDG